MNGSTALSPKVWFITGISRGFGKALAGTRRNSDWHHP